MRECVICRFVVETDDVEILAGSGHCICVRCYHGEVDSPDQRRQMSTNAVSPVAREVRRMLGTDGGPH